MTRRSNRTKVTLNKSENSDYDHVKKYVSYVLNFFRAVFIGKSNERKPHKKSPEKWEKKSEEHKKKNNFCDLFLKYI